MAMLTKPAFGPRTSIGYITIGTLMVVWTAVWYFAFIRPNTEPMSQTTFFWLTGLSLTGITLVVIGLFLGQIGQAARRAELPPSEALAPEARIQNTAAATGVAPAAPSAAPVVGAVPAAAPAPYVAPGR